MLKKTSTIAHQLYNVMVYNLGLINTHFFQSKINIQNIERVDVNNTLDSNGEYVRITTTENHGINDVAFENEQTLTIRGVRNEYNIDNIEILNNGRVIKFTLPVGETHNINQENVIDIEFINFNNSLLANKSFMVQGKFTEYQANNILEFYVAYNKQTYFTESELSDLSGTNRKISILAFSSNNKQQIDFQHVNRTVKKSELLHLTNTSFVYKASITQRNLKPNQYAQSIQLCQVIYGLVMQLDTSLEKFIVSTNMIRAQGEEIVAENFLVLLDRGRQTFANVNRPYGENNLSSKKHAQYNLDIVIFLKRTESENYVSENIQTIYNTFDDILTILSNYNRLNDNLLEFYTLSSPFSENGINPIDSEAGDYAHLGTWYNMNITVHGAAQYNKYKFRDLSFGYDGVSIDCEAQDSNGKIIVEQLAS